jgi:6,7-dimethyl-8-ribityllumazine synthase
MNQPVRGHLDASRLRLAIVCSRYNEEITSRLLTGAREALRAHGARDDELLVVSVPGAWELPLAARQVIDGGDYHAVICLGCVIRGETTHHEHVAGQAARGLAEVSLATGVPIGFGLLTTDSEEQALERAGGRVGNKGEEAALAAVEMANLRSRLPADQTI